MSEISHEKIATDRKTTSRDASASKKLTEIRWWQNNQIFSAVLDAKITGTLKKENATNLICSLKRPQILSQGREVPQTSSFPIFAKSSPRFDVQGSKNLFSQLCQEIDSHGQLKPCTAFPPR